jgi:SAM-dependent methyltransferase
MGISADSLQFVLQGRRAAASFERVLTLGRQHLNVAPERAERMLRAAGFWPPALGVEEYRRRMADVPRRFETLLEILGARGVEACDASPYEGATWLHDFNEPIDAGREGQYDVVVDGGTIEHVFNFPVAIANCMRLVRVQGLLLLLTPANNYFGHGFYQFSPELFYRVLGPANGFQIERMIALADSDGFSSVFGVTYPFPITSGWYEVPDPAAVRRRVTLINHNPVLLYIRARKTAQVPVFKAWPQQSDYAEQWLSHGGTSARAALTPPQGQPSAGLRGWLRRRFSEAVCRELLPRLAWFVDPLRLARFRRRNSFHNRALYRLVKPPGDG